MNRLVAKSAAVCPDCYGYLTSKEILPARDPPPDGSARLVNFYCNYCKKVTMPVFVDIILRRSLKLRKARAMKSLRKVSFAERERQEIQK